MSAPATSSRPEMAFYYPGHLWKRPDWVKTLLLFFDGVALLVPEYKRHEIEREDPELAEVLREQGLLHFLIADEVVDGPVTAKLAEALEIYFQAGAFDRLSAKGTAFHAISMSRMGFAGDEAIARELFEKLASRGLAKTSLDGVSVPLHPAVRHLILVLLAQIIRTKGADGFDLSPATDQGEVVRALIDVLNLSPQMSTGAVVQFDSRVVAVDLSQVPLDEVLDFRAQNFRAHRTYVRSARKFARDCSLLPEPDRTQAVADRQAELDEMAASLEEKAQSSWRAPASFALSLAGAAHTAHKGDPVGALLSAGSLLLKGPGLSKADTGAYSYLFKAKAWLG